AIGGKNLVQAQEMTFASMMMGLLLGMALIVPAIASIEILFPLLGAAPERMVLIHEYMSWWYLGMPFLLMQFAGTAVIRASGNAKLHGKLMAASAVLNAVLDPLLIFGFGPISGMGMGGAGLAIVLTYVASVAAIGYFLCT